MDSYTKIAYLKIVKRQIEKEIEFLEKKLKAQERFIELGKFKRIQKTTINVDKNRLLKSIPLTKFVEAASFSKTNLNNILAPNTMKKLEAKDIIVYEKSKDSLTFYIDKTVQLPKINILISRDQEHFDYTINP